MRKRTLSLCLSLILLFVSVVPLTVQAQDSVCDDVVARAGEELKAPDDADSELIAVLLFHERALEEMADEDYEDAVATLTRAIDLDPIYADSYLYRGCANLGVGDRDTALDDFSKFVLFSDDGIMIDRVQEFVDAGMQGGMGGTALLCVGGTSYEFQSEAQADVDSINALGENLEADDYNDRGLAYICLGESEQAIRDFSRALDLDKSEAVYYSNRAIVYIETGAYENAIVDLERSIELDDQNAVTMNNLGVAYGEQGEFDAALDAYNRAIELDPNYAQAYRNRGFLYEDFGDLDSAYENYTRAIELEPTDAGYFNDRGNILLDYGQYEDALDDYQTAVDLQPDNYVYWNNVGYTHRLLGDYDRALDALSTALDIYPEYSTALINRAVVYWRSGLPRLCVEDYGTAIELRPDSALVYNNRALCYEDLEEFDLALSDYEISLALEPGDPITLGNYASLLSDLGMYEEAVVNYEAALAVEIDPLLYNDLGFTYRQMGDDEKAYEYYTLAIELEPEYSTAYLNRGYVNRDLGNRAEAVSDFRTYLDLVPDSDRRLELLDIIRDLNAE